MERLLLYQLNYSDGHIYAEIDGVLMFTALFNEENGGKGFDVPLRY